MKTLSPIHTAWKWLNGALSAIIDAINQRTPIGGNGISVSELPNGFIIALERLPTSKPGTQQPGDGLTSLQIGELLQLAQEPVYVPPADPLAVPFIPWMQDDEGRPASSGWLRINIMDAQCQQFQIWVWATKPTPVGGP